MLEQVLTNADLPEDQAACAPRLMGVVLQHCRGRVDAVVGAARPRLQRLQAGSSRVAAPARTLHPALHSS